MKVRTRSRRLLPAILALLLGAVLVGAAAAHPTGAAAAGTVLFSDDFEQDAVGSPAPGWTISAGTWVVAQDGTNVLRETNLTTSSAKVISAPGPWTDAAYTAQLKPGTTATGTSNVLAARYQDYNDTYGLILKNGNSWYFGKKVAGTFITWASGSFPYNTSTWYTLEIDTLGTAITAYLNGTQLATVNDSTYASGGIAFMSSYEMEVDNVGLTQLGSAPTPTPTPIATPTSTPSPTPAPTPTATPSPAPSPTATPVPTPTATPTPAPTPTATPTPSTTPAPSPTPTPTGGPGTVLYQDDFESDTVGSPAAGWTASSGTWLVAADGTQVLQQQTTSTSSAYTVSAGAGPWSDYSVSADVKPGTTAVGTSNVLNARNQDANNHYSLILKDGSAWVFEKKVGGSVTIFAKGSFSYNTSTWYTLEIDAQGSTLTAKVNGTVLASTTDSTFSSGGIAFMSRYEMEVDNVVVTQLSPGPTPTPAPTPTPSPGPSPTPSPTASPTPAPTPTATPTPSPTPTQGPPGTVTGTVVDQATGNPIAGALVTTSPAGGSATTDQSGTYTLSAAPGTYDVLVTASGYNGNFVGGVTVASGSSSTAGVSLVAVPANTDQDLFSRPDSPGPSLGTASDGHSWATDLNVYPHGQATITNREALIKTASAFTDHDTWMGQSYQNVEITVDLDMTNVAFDPSYQHGARLLARVGGNDDWVIFTINPSNDTLQLWTDKNGSWNEFAATSLALNQAAWYHAKMDAIGSTIEGKVWQFGTAEPGWQITGKETSITGAGEVGLRTTVSDTYYQNFQAVALTSAGGQVTDSSTGNPVAGATVTLSTGATTTTDASGDYSFTGLAPGTYSVTATDPGFSTQPSASFTVAAGTNATADLAF